jgi:CBS domain-containing protein
VLEMFAPDPSCIAREKSALEAAKLMRNDHIGNVVVVDERAGRKVPLGIVTDRDIVVRLVAKEVDPGDITVTDLMAQGGVRCARRRRYSRCHSAHALSRRETASGR